MEELKNNYLNEFKGLERFLLTDAIDMPENQALDKMYTLYINEQKEIQTKYSKSTDPEIDIALQILRPKKLIDSIHKKKLKRAKKLNYKEKINFIQNTFNFKDKFIELDDNGVSSIYFMNEEYSNFCNDLLYRSELTPFNYICIEADIIATALQKTDLKDYYNFLIKDKEFLEYINQSNKAEFEKTKKMVIRNNKIYKLFVDLAKIYVGSADLSQHINNPDLKKMIDKLFLASAINKESLIDIFGSELKAEKNIRIEAVLNATYGEKYNHHFKELAIIDNNEKLNYEEVRDEIAYNQKMLHYFCEKFLAEQEIGNLINEINNQANDRLN